VFEFLLDKSENFPCSVSALLVKTVLQLDELQLLILFIGTLTYLEPRVFLYSCFIIRIS
jgi:hypothetical protein